MTVRFGRLLFLMGLLALITCMAPIMGTRNGIAQGEVTIGVDADPAGNTATSLGPIDSCIAVKKGDTFQIDLFVTDVDNLLAWEIYFSFDGDVVNVTDRDVQMFLAANAGSEVWDASDPLPSSGGLYRLGAVDIGQPPAPDSGSGVLARLTLKAVGAGLSPTILTTLDANNDGKIELGPQVSSIGAKAIGDTNGDGFFDGPLLGAQIAVDRDCPAAPTRTPVATMTAPTLSPTVEATSVAAITPTAILTVTAQTASPTPRTTASPGTVASPTPLSTATPSENGGTDWTSGGFIVVYVVVGAVAALLLGGGVFLAVTRRRSP
jgi:hypothetical protein